MHIDDSHEMMRLFESIVQKDLLGEGTPDSRQYDDDIEDRGKDSLESRWSYGAKDNFNELVETVENMDDSDVADAIMQMAFRLGGKQIRHTLKDDGVRDLIQPIMNILAGVNKSRDNLSRTTIPGYDHSDAEKFHGVDNSEGLEESNDTGAHDNKDWEDVYSEIHYGKGTKDDFLDILFRDCPLPKNTPILNIDALPKLIQELGRGQSFERRPDGNISTIIRFLRTYLNSYKDAGTEELKRFHKKMPNVFDDPDRIGYDPKHPLKFGATKKKIPGPKTALPESKSSSCQRQEG